MCNGGTWTEFGGSSWLGIGMFAGDASSNIAIGSRVGVGALVLLADEAEDLGFEIVG